MRSELVSGGPATGSPTVGVDTRDMLEVHTVLRREFGLARAHIRGCPVGDVARAARIAAHLELSMLFLDIHHSEEDRQLWPKLRERAAAQIAPVVALMENQHEGIHRATETMTSRLQPWIRTAAAADRDRLAAALDHLCELLGEHLALEEEKILPVVAGHLSEQEWQRIGQDGFARAPKKLLPLAFGMLMYQGDPTVVAAMLANAPRLARVLVPRLAPHIYARYARRVHGTATP
jgi:hemerythrin-like domain-containing protein